ncbi:MAG: ATP-grasp domain-containing protein [Paracoccaceae bacterium]|nr:ATP-grasp domain-containing protein [Paracoccaceae bacterium]
MKSERAAAFVFVDIDLAQTPLYSCRGPQMQAARRSGYVPVTVAEAHNPHLAAIKADSDHLILVPDLSSTTLEAALAELETTHRVAAIFAYPGQERPGADINTAVEALCHARGLPAPSAKSLRRANNKLLMRQCLAEAGLPSASYVIVSSRGKLEEAAQHIGFPVFCKPPYGAASAFSTRCDTLHELFAHFDRFTQDFEHSDSARENGGRPQLLACGAAEEIAFSPGRSLLLEEWLDGPEGTVECVVGADGDVHAMIIHDKLLVEPVANTVLEHLLVTPPVRFDAPAQAAIKAYARDCIAALGLRNSMVHFEFKLTEAGPRVIEINPRLGGFYVDRSWQELTGFDPYELTVRLRDATFDPGVLQAAGQLVTDSEQLYTMFVLYPEQAGQIVAVEGIEELTRWPGVLDCAVMVPNRPVDPTQSEVCVVKVFAEVPSADAALELYAHACKQVRIVSAPTPQITVPQAEMRSHANS